MRSRARDPVNFVDSLWYGATPTGRVVRTLLLPVSWLYGAGVRLRNARYARDGHAVKRAGIPVLSVGNVTVGGTGKTPVAAWAASRLRALGATPAIVMRGYGDDEPLVHARLNPDVRIVADPDRARGVESARVQGADVAILDDGFQHRRLGRDSDWVLVAAEQWHADAALLPAGPLREPLEALKRADVIVVTRKSASAHVASELAGSLARRFPQAGVAVCHLTMDALVNALTGAREPLARLRSGGFVATAAVGQPAAFFSQLEALGARIERRAFRDHRAFSAADVAVLASEAERLDGVVCTLKDAVKLAPLWPRAGPTLWYVSQIVVIERGLSVLDDALHQILAKRSGAYPPFPPSTAGSAGPSS